MSGARLFEAGFYQWCTNPVAGRVWEKVHLISAAYNVHTDDPEFGHRFMAEELHAAGSGASERRAWRFCSQEQLISHTIKRARKHGKKPGPPVCDDLVQRDFTASSTNEVRLTDITEHHTGEGKLYMRAVKDVHSNKIVGYTIDSRIKSRLAVAAIEDAVVRRGRPQVVAECVVHSDNGTQIRSRKFQHAVKRLGLVGSMGRVGAAGDNAAMGSFFAVLQKNVLDRRRPGTRAQIFTAIEHWVERRNRRKRRQSRLDKHYGRIRTNSLQRRRPGGINSGVNSTFSSPLTATDPKARATILRAQINSPINQGYLTIAVGPSRTRLNQSEESNQHEVRSLGILGYSRRLQARSYLDRRSNTNYYRAVVARNHNARCDRLCFIRRLADYANQSDFNAQRSFGAVVPLLYTGATATRRFRASGAWGVER